jgi:hypothetical protein
MKNIRFGIASLAVTGAAIFALSSEARAFSLGGLADVFGSFAPVLGDVFKADLGQYVSKIQSAASIADSLKSGDFMTAAADVGYSLGDFGVVDLGKYREKLLASSNYNASKDYGIGLYGNNYLAESEGMEQLAKLQGDANSSQTAQDASVQKMEGMSKTLDAMVSQAIAAAKTNNSLSAIKTIPASLTALGGLVTQNTTATMDVGKATKHNGVLLTQIMANQLQTTRADMRAGQGRTSMYARRNGFLLGVMGNEPDQNQSSGFSTTTLPSSINLSP